MPFTPKGSKILKNFRKQYGTKEGTANFWKSVSKGKLKGVEGKKPR